MNLNSKVKDAYGTDEMLEMQNSCDLSKDYLLVIQKDKL
jgi:hypothetical protein